MRWSFLPFAFMHTGFSSFPLRQASPSVCGMYPYVSHGSGLTLWSPFAFSLIHIKSISIYLIGFTFQNISRKLHFFSTSTFLLIHCIILSHLHFQSQPHNGSPSVYQELSRQHNYVQVCGSSSHSSAPWKSTMFKIADKALESLVLAHVCRSSSCKPLSLAQSGPAPVIHSVPQAFGPAPTSEPVHLLPPPKTLSPCRGPPVCSFACVTH